uniref:Uncharacterized protein n=1 Tax=Salix viminalis TaxID=40686 RepID=A0A6N2MT81_SALVM
MEERSLWWDEQSRLINYNTNGIQENTWWSNVLSLRSISVNGIDAWLKWKKEVVGQWQHQPGVRVTVLLNVECYYSAG